VLREVPRLNVEDLVNEFRHALERAERTFKLEVPLDVATKIEELQLEVIDELKEKAHAAVEENKSLDQCVAEVLPSLLNKYYLTFIEELDLRNNVEDLGEAILNLEAGRIDTNGSRVVFLIVQAVARAYAEAFERVKGVIERRSTRCPLCNVESDIIVRWPDGTYRMLCPFCGYTWIVSRGSLVCPRCGSKNPVALGVFSDRERRVGLFVCQDCGYKAKIILDVNIVKRFPRSVLPLIALNGERYRPFLREL